MNLRYHVVERLNQRIQLACETRIQATSVNQVLELIATLFELLDGVSDFAFGQARFRLTEVIDDGIHLAVAKLARILQGLHVVNDLAGNVYRVDVGDIDRQCGEIVGRSTHGQIVDFDRDVEYRVGPEVDGGNRLALLVDL